MFTRIAFWLLAEAAISVATVFVITFLGMGKEINTKKNRQRSARVYVNVSGTSYHWKNCRALRRKSKGVPLIIAKDYYTPCKICKPQE